DDPAILDEDALVRPGRRAGAVDEPIGDEQAPTDHGDRMSAPYANNAGSPPVWMNTTVSRLSSTPVVDSRTRPAIPVAVYTGSSTSPSRSTARRIAARRSSVITPYPGPATASSLAMVVASG